MTGRAALYWHTVRYLRPRQIFDRLWRRLYVPRIRTITGANPRAAHGRWIRPARREASMTAPLTFRFLEEARAVAPDRWDAHDASHLWRYNLHYFDDLNADGAAARTAWHSNAIDAWIAANAPGSSPGWDPYPASLRIVNWIKWACAGNRLPRIAADSLATQLAWLEHRLEFHLGGNHLFANAKALVFGGTFLEGPDARRWRERGLEILADEMSVQVLPDGGHFERSTMYHALALEDVLDLLNLSRAYPGSIPEPTLIDASRRMLGWLDAMCHPDGEISFFNDAAIGIAPAPAELHRYAREMLGLEKRREGTVRLHDSGYVRIEKPGCVLIADVAPIGPDELPGHAHADTLSFELSVLGERVIVNGGTSRYGAGPERERERGTQAHSTVQIDGRDSSEVWSGFRVARRAHPLEVSFVDAPEAAVLSAAHDGYTRLPGNAIHHRRWVVAPGLVRIHDRIEGRFGRAVARFHLKPGVRCEIDDSGTSGVITSSSGRSITWHAEGARATLEDSAYAPRFGVRLATRCLALEMRPSEEAILELMW